MNKIIQAMCHDPNKPLTWRNFSFKKTVIGDNSWYFFYWVIIMLLIFLYKLDTGSCTAMIENINETCTNFCFTQIPKF